jgi:hypothetical protein
VVNNIEHILAFLPAESDGDTFWYTELLDRSKRVRGNNGVRLLRSFYHESRDELIKHMPTITRLCDLTGCRAYIRLSPRTYTAVSKLFAERVVRAALEGGSHARLMRRLYSSCCGTVTPKQKVWILDVDDLAPWADYHNDDKFPAEVLDVIPSRKGLHVVVKPFDAGRYQLPTNPTIHKDNPTNLYIPDSAP